MIECPLVLGHTGVVTVRRLAWRTVSGARRDGDPIAEQPRHSRPSWQGWHARFGRCEGLALQKQRGRRSPDVKQLLAVRLEATKERNHGWPAGHFGTEAAESSGSAYRQQLAADETKCSQLADCPAGFCNKFNRTTLRATCGLSLAS